MSIIIKSGNSANLANVNSQGNLGVAAAPAAVSQSASPWNSASPINTIQNLLEVGGYTAITVQLDITRHKLNRN